MPAKRRILEWPVKELLRRRGTISFPDYQREPKLWRLTDKQRLIDSILQEIDIPPLYFYRLPGNTEEYEVVDGQQRLWAIWGFLEGEYPVRIQTSLVNFHELDARTRDRILEYGMHITILSGVSEEYLRELFIRLQLGLLLNAGEKLHAMTGSMRKFVFTELVEQPFIQQIRIPERRFAKETLCSQIGINAFSRLQSGAFARTRYEDLRAFFERFAKPSGRENEFFTSGRKHIMAVLDFLNRYFKSNAKVLRNRSLILSTYLLAEDIFVGKSSQRDQNMQLFVSFIELLVEELRRESKLGIDRSNKHLFDLQTYLSTAPGEIYQIERRHQKLSELFEFYKRRRKIKS